MKKILVPTKYELYLQSDEFDEIRQAVFERDQYKCSICGATEDLRPHHLTYRNIYHEPLCDLITVCARCHSIYHAIQKRADYIHDYYVMQEKTQKQQWEDEYQKQREQQEHEEQRRKEASNAIWNEIISEYSDQDYSKGGQLDCCNWQVLERIIKEKQKQHDVNYVYFNKTDLREYFLWRRYCFLQRCLEQGIKPEKIAQKTLLSETFINKWYRKDKLEARIAQGDLLFKEETNEKN